MTTKERILDAALELFAEEGVAGTTITEIERRAGLTAGSGSLYRHFRSKDEVLDATIVREVERLRNLVAEERAALPRLPDRRSQLLLEFHQCLRDVQRFDRLLRILQRDAARAKKIPGIVVRILGLDRGLVAWTRDTTTADPDGLDPLTAMVVVSAVVGYHNLSQFNRKPFMQVGDDAFVERLVDLVAPTG